jgi:hypothetical protein
VRKLESIYEKAGIHFTKTVLDQKQEGKDARAPSIKSSSAELEDLAEEDSDSADIGTRIMSREKSLPYTNYLHKLSDLKSSTGGLPKRSPFMTHQSNNNSLDMNLSPFNGALNMSWKKPIVEDHLNESIISRSNEDTTKKHNWAKAYDFKTIEIHENADIKDI